MKDDYLWDGSGEPDPEVVRLEGLLGRFRHTRPAPEFPWPARPEAMGAHEPQRHWFRTLVPRLAVAAAIVLVAAGAWFAVRWTRPGWEVARLEGSPKVGSSRITGTGRLAVGQWLETDGSSRAEISVGMIGVVRVEPNTRLRLLRARANEQRLALVRGTVHAHIWAPPRLFTVETPSAVAVDLGCTYTLHVDDSGAGMLRVTNGWVAFELSGRESFVPEGALCATRPGIGPGTPYYEDASKTFRRALAQLDFELNGVSGGVHGGVPGGVSGGVSRPAKLRAEALDTVLAESRKRDALALWHLLSRVNESERALVYDRMATLVPPPPGVTRDGILQLDRRMLDLWWNQLGLRNATWWRFWKGPWPPPAK